LAKERGAKTRAADQVAPMDVEERWLAENREAIASINVFVERHGLLASKLRYRAQTP
jgi:post-segregation antitoxin (ccd killing protein)